MSPRIGELFAGYGGLGMGVKAVLGGDVAWVSEIDRGACKVLAHRFPGVPNHGDITTVDWSQVEPVEVVCAGFPCQPVSNAGKQLGLEDERWLFGEVVRALGELDPQPRLCVLENVPRLRTLDRGHVMAAVIHGLASVGYVGRYRLLRASDVDACHKRERLFFAAHPRGETGQLWAGLRPDGQGGERGRQPARVGGAPLLPTPRATDGTKGGPNQRGSSGDLMLPSAVALLPTPAVNDMGEGKTIEWWDEWAPRQKAADGRRAVHRPSLAIEAQRLLPTPDANMGNGGRTRSPEALARGDRQTNLDDLARLLPTPTVEEHGRRSGSRADELLLDGIAKAGEWGDYAAAIHRWEQTLGRPAPAPTQTSAKGNPQLAPAFVEWMMGLPEGWVTDVPGITRNEALKLCGNGVVPQQAEAALRVLLSRMAVAA